MALQDGAFAGGGGGGGAGAGLPASPFSEDAAAAPDHQSRGGEQQRRRQGELLAELQRATLRYLNKALLRREETAQRERAPEPPPR